MEVRERTIAGRYRLEEVIGRGGMSTVYRASDEVLDRDVAIKVLLPALAEQDPTYAARFEREARAAAALATPAVVTIYDTGVDDDGGQYIVMEYVAGHSLAELLADGRPLETSEAIRIAGRVADALGAAHGAGILHRDIKPANVMLADDGTVKVLDFGIARTLGGTTLTQTASVLGTAAYMAPERALGQPGDARADIYSLGCLLYAMLTGRSPFTGDVAAALLHQQVNTDPLPPSRRRGGVGAGVDALVLAMLAKAPEARPQSASEVRDLLARLSEPTSADATAATVPLASAVRAPRGVLGDHRRRALVLGLATAAIALLAVALLAGGGSGTPTAASTHRARTVTRHSTTPQTLSKPKAPKPATPAAATPAAAGPTAHPGPPGPPGQGPPGKHKHGQHGGPGKHGGSGGGGDGGGG